jgi:hypothetical protein
VDVVSASFFKKVAKGLDHFEKDWPIRTRDGGGGGWVFELRTWALEIAATT